MYSSFYSVRLIADKYYQVRPLPSFTDVALATSPRRSLDSGPVIGSAPSFAALKRAKAGAAPTDATRAGVDTGVEPLASKSPGISAARVFPGTETEKNPERSVPGDFGGEEANGE